MKKLLLILMLACGTAFAQNVKVATPANPSQNILSGVTVNSSTNMVVPGSLTVSNDFVLPKSAALNFIWTCTNANGGGTWLVNSGTNSIPGSVVLTNNVLFLNALTNVTSVGSGASLRNAVSNNIFYIKSIVGSNGVSIVDGGTNLTIVGSGSGTSSVLTTNLQSAIGSPSTYTWLNMLQITTTATTGNVLVNARTMTLFPNGAVMWIRVRDALTNTVYHAHQDIDDAITTSPILTEVSFIDTLSGSAKTYFMDAASSTANQPYTNSYNTGGNQTPIPLTNGLGMTVIQLP